MYIEKIPNRNSPPAILLRESWREGKRIRKRTIANLSQLPGHVIETLQRALKGEHLVSIHEVFRIERSFPHGHVAAVVKMIRRLGLDNLIAAKRTRQRDIVMAMIVERLIHPSSKLANTRLWKTTSLGKELDVEDAKVDELYDALRWLLRRQRRIENKLAARHLSEDSPVLYDVTSSYYEGRTCPLAMFGHSRDHRKDRPQIVYGVMTDEKGRPVAVDVYPGNTGDPSTVIDQVEKLRTRFGLGRVVLVGDRGMLTQTKIDILRQFPGIGWISALKSGAISSLIQSGTIQMSLFDKTNLAEISSPEFPGERLIVCYNPFLAEERTRKREALLDQTRKALDKIATEVKRRTKTPLMKDQIALKVGKIINRYKMGKHFSFTIEDGQFLWRVDKNAVETEKMLDGIYVVRTSEPKKRFSAEKTVRTYKSLSLVEHAFRTLKGIDIRVRPIYHRLEETVRAHIFLCLLAYYVEWHMRHYLAPLLFEDEDIESTRLVRDPVAPAESSVSAKIKKSRRRTSDGFPVHSFETLLQDLATQSKNICLSQLETSTTRVELITEPTPLQTRVFELLDVYPVNGSQE